MGSVPEVDSTPASCAYLITGIPGAGKSTVARALAGALPWAAHIEADVLQAMLVSGGEWPTPEMRAVARRQLFLRARNAAVLANSFAAAGFVPVIDHIVISREQFEHVRSLVYVRPLHLVVLAPSVEVMLARNRERPAKDVGETWAHLDAELRRELHGAGLWIDSSRMTVDAVVAEVLARTRGSFF